MLSVINPSQIQQQGVLTFSRPVNPVIDDRHPVSGSFCGNTGTTDAYNLCNREQRISVSCNVNAFPVNRDAYSSSNSISRNHQSTLTSSNSNSSNSFNLASSIAARAELNYRSSSSKNRSTCSTTPSSSHCASSSMGSGMSQNNSLFSKPWNPSNIFHPGSFRGFPGTDRAPQQNQMQQSSSTSDSWLNCSLSRQPTRETLVASSSIHRRMSTNSSMMGSYNFQHCRHQQLQEHELEKTRKRLSVNNSLFCNPSTSRVTNQSLPQPDGSSSKDFTNALFVDCSIEYELPNAPKIPKNSDPILMIHPGIKRKKGKQEVEDMAQSKNNMIKEEAKITSTDRASMLENVRTNETNADTSAKETCHSSKCSCQEAVQYRKKYQLHLQRQQSKIHAEKSNCVVKKELVFNSSRGSDNQMIQDSNQTVRNVQGSASSQAGSKRSYAQAIGEESKIGEKRALNTNDDNLSRTATSAFQHPIHSDRSSYYSGSISDNLYNRNLQRLQYQESNQLGSSKPSNQRVTSSISGKAI